MIKEIRTRVQSSSLRVFPGLKLGNAKYDQNNMFLVAYQFIVERATRNLTYFLKTKKRMMIQSVFMNMIPYTLTDLIVKLIKNRSVSEQGDYLQVSMQDHTPI